MDAVVRVQAESSNLAAAIQRARTLLDEGDYKAALILSGGAYDEAQAAVNFAKRMKASDSLVEKARRLQADALLIEAQAKIALAADYDRAVREGQMAPAGRPRKDAGNNSLATLTDIGISKTTIFDSRQLRRSELKQPGFIAQCIIERIDARLEPSRANLRKAIHGLTNPLPSNPVKPDARGPRLRSGEVVATLRWYEIPEVLRQIGRDVALLEAVYRFGVPLNPDQTIGEVIGELVLSEFAKRSGHE